MLAIGVTYDEFWHREAEVTRYAIEAFQVSERNRVIAEDTMAWNAGRYVMIAVGTIMSQAFSKGSRAEYPTEPMIATELDEKLAEQKRERELRRAHADFLAFAAAMQRQQGLGEPN